MRQLHTIECINISDRQKADILSIWNTVYPEKLMFQNINALEDYLSGLQSIRHILMEDENGKTLAWAFSFLREDERWFAILIDDRIQQQGYGRILLNTLKQKESVLKAWVIDHHNDKRRDGQIYQSPLLFYIKNDFQVESECRLELEKISAVKIVWKRKLIP